MLVRVSTTTILQIPSGHVNNPFPLIDPASGVGLKIWTCYPNIAAQSWQYYEEYGTFELANNSSSSTFSSLARTYVFISDHLDQCIDLPNGVLTNGNQLQTWECADCNPNQLWERA